MEPTVREEERERKATEKAVPRMGQGRGQRVSIADSSDISNPIHIQYELDARHGGNQKFDVDSEPAAHKAETQSTARPQTWGKPAAKHGAALFLLSLVVGVILAVYAFVARNSAVGLPSVLLVSCGLCLIVGGLCLTKAREVVSKHTSGDTSGKNFMQNLGLAISCAQIFFVVINATKNLLPKLYVRFVLHLAIFSLDLTLALPSLQRDEVEWVQFILQLLICVGACLFLIFGDVASNDDENKKARKEIEAKIRSSRGSDADAQSKLEQHDMNEICKEKSKSPKKLVKLPWQGSMDRIILLGEGRTTPAILSGVFAAGVVLAGSSLGLGATDVAKVLVVAGSVLALVAFTALAIRQWLCFEKQAAITMFASLTVAEAGITMVCQIRQKHTASRQEMHTIRTSRGGTSGRAPLWTSPISPSSCSTRFSCRWSSRSSMLLLQSSRVTAFHSCITFSSQVYRSASSALLLSLDGGSTMLP
jgi:cell division protein FtsW (lipid II flippase)